MKRKKRRCFYETGNDNRRFQSLYRFTGACWDVGHANHNIMPQYEALKTLGKHTKASHIQDNYGVLNEDNHIAPFFGNINIDAVMHGLIDTGYDGHFTFEATSFFLP